MVSKSPNRVLLGCIIGAGLVVVLGLFGLVVGGLMVVTDEVEAELKENSVVAQHLGTVQECEHAWVRSMIDRRFVFFHYDCRGDKGVGHFEIHSEPIGPDATEQIIEGVLVMPSGERYDIMGE
jgi:hypothetical protein